MLQVSCALTAHLLLDSVYLVCSQAHTSGKLGGLYIAVWCMCVVCSVYVIHNMLHCRPQLSLKNVWQELQFSQIRTGTRQVRTLVEASTMLFYVWELLGD